MTYTSPEELGTVLSIWAHPDDETYLAGGVMAAAADNDQTVVCVSATAGEHGTDDPATWPPEILGAKRREEAAAAMSILGIEDHRWLGFEDGTLAGLDDDVAVSRLTDLIAEVHPNTILTFGPDGMTFHSDHQTVGRWTELAWDRTGRTAQLLVAAPSAEHYGKWGTLYDELGIYMTDQRPLALLPEALALTYRLEGDSLERKVDALSAMPSQTAALVSAVGIDTYREMNRLETFARGGSPDPKEAINP